MSPPAPVPKPGSFGQFPAAFGMYFRASSSDKKNHYFYLGTDKSTPSYALTVHKGLKRTLQAQLHSTPAWDAQPLALFGIEGVWRATSVLTLPALSETGGTAPRVEKLKDLGGFKEERHSFTVPTASGNSLQDQTFEWRAISDMKKLSPGELRVKKLFRAGSEEVLAMWTEEQHPVEQMALGYFQFTEAAQSAQFGGYWTLVAVASGIRLAQVKWEASAYADQMIKGAAKVTTKAGALIM